MPIRFNTSGLSYLGGEGDPIGALSFDADEGGLVSIFMFDGPHYADPGRCEQLELNSSCTEDCRINLSEYPLTLVEDGASLYFEAADQCEWEREDEPLVEVMCDGIDNNCNGIIDESEDPSIPSVGDPCGETVDACTSQGVYECVATLSERPTCNAPVLMIENERCDGIDNDCNGEIDEGFELGMACQDLEGICRASGEVSCVLEEDAIGYPMRTVGGTFCRLTELGTEQRRIDRELGVECDGEDNDCDGFTDEHATPTLVMCGEGACVESALAECNGGELVSLCRDGEPSGLDDNCDLIDDDCDGRADEAYVPETVSCGTGACRSNGYITCSSTGQIEICTPNQGASQDNDCDGIDDDCDLLLDEDYLGEETTCGIGECTATGRRGCQSGILTNSCQPGTPQLDNQCDGRDNDCDGRADEGYIPENTRCGDGVCASTGRRLCVGGELFDTCEPSTPLDDEDFCDGFDYDCDGDIDEDHVNTATSCGQGACAAQGVLACQQGQVVDTCNPSAPAAGDFDAACDTIDSDCDGRADEGYVGDQVACGAGACAASGVRTCINGDESGDTCVVLEMLGTDDNCNGIDDDCDGSIDESYVETPTSCGLGLCTSIGSLTCSDGQLRDTCVAGIPLDGDAICDTLDSDCDGRVDEGYPVTATSCGLGVCARQGLLTCVAGAESDSCVAPDPSSADNQCDGADNDCDGQIDEAYNTTATPCGLGACAQTGQLICVNGREEDTCVPLVSNLTDHRCDGVDADCDGAVDEAYAVSEVSCGLGACSRLGETACVNGEETEVCTPGQPANDDPDCDQVDDDCDGSLDEDFEPVDVMCVMGACGTQGQEICTSNGLTNTCVQAPAPDDASCNGVDDDCDGTFDEDYMPPIASSTISCGVGVCENTNGQLQCVEGSVLPVCEPFEPLGADNNCNGLDEDCDGSVDEGYSEVSVCGLGVCQVTSEKVCVNQMIIDLCQENPPTSPFDICGADQDSNCDGQIDTYDLGESCSISQNTCVSDGVLVCNPLNNGTECNAPPIVPDTESCNGEDDDCDGNFDENIVYSSPYCLAVGVTGACVDGSKYCHESGSTRCQPGEPTVELTCNNIDEDCDGFIDEEVIDPGTENEETRRLGEDCDQNCRWQCGPSDLQLTCRHRNSGMLCE